MQVVNSVVYEYYSILQYWQNFGAFGTHNIYFSILIILFMF
jgi:hypothetical protein